MSLKQAVLSFGVVGLLAACGDFTPNTSNKTNTNPVMDPTSSRNPEESSIFGAQGLGNLFGGKPVDPNSTTGIGVNSYLWRASLDTVAFMPLASADPFGGVIITDWYSQPENPLERFKINIFIMDRTLRADGLRATVFRQRRDLGGAWQDAAVEPATATDLENAILSRARQMRVGSAAK